MFLHGGIGHLLFNMLSLWMFGTELERRWGTRFFTKYYFVTGIGAGVTTLLWSISPLPYADAMYYSVMIGASGAIYGMLLAYGMSFPHRDDLPVLRLPGSGEVLRDDRRRHHLSLLDGRGRRRRGAHRAPRRPARRLHLSQGPALAAARRSSKYRWLRWKMNRARGKFDVYSGGQETTNWKSDWKKHIH